MPQPSPALGSAPTAPRWSRLSRICSPIATMACDFRFFMSATKPTPQESCSLRGVVEALRVGQAGIAHHGRAGGDVAQASAAFAGALAPSSRCVVSACPVRWPIVASSVHPVPRLPRSSAPAFSLRAFSALPASGKPIAPAGALSPEPVFSSRFGRAPSCARSSRAPPVYRPGMRPSGPRFASGTFTIALGQWPVARRSCVRAGLVQCGRPRSWAVARQLGQQDCPNVAGHCQISEGDTSGQNRLSCKIVEVSRSRPRNEWKVGMLSRVSVLTPGRRAALHWLA